MKRIITRTWYFLCAQDSSYTWSDGWPVFFTHWGPGEPSNVADEGCVAMHGARFFHGTWNDTKCDLAKPYICKITTGTEKTDRVSVQSSVSRDIPSLLVHDNNKKTKLKKPPYNSIATLVVTVNPDKIKAPPQHRFPCFCDLREAAAHPGPRLWQVPPVLGDLRPPLLLCVQRPAGFLLARLATLLPVGQRGAGVDPQQSRGGVHQKPQLHQVSRPVDRPHPGQQL